MSQKIVQLPYKTSSQLGIEPYATLLNQLCRAFEDVVKEAIPWLLHTKDELNIPVTVMLLRSGLVNVSLQEQLIKMNPRRVVEPADLHYRGPRSARSSRQGQRGESKHLRNFGGRCPPAIYKARKRKTLHVAPEMGTLKVEGIPSFFFRVCLVADINNYMKYITAGQDASGVNNDQAKVHHFALVLANMHEEQGAVFQQKPFFGLFSSSVNDLHSMEAHLGTARRGIIVTPSALCGLCTSQDSRSHRHFLPKLLLAKNCEGWSAFHKLLLSLLKFLAPFLKEYDLQLAARDLYRGTLHLLLVLLHAPEYHPQRITPLHSPSRHLRNVKFDSIPDMDHMPPISSDFASVVRIPELRNGLDQYLQCYEQQVQFSDDMV
ncbi:hypothetical protein SCLCIDRAFT_33938 [Scleroderma citrinum Foug A]|uniref:CCR4-Not complex component Not1 C-terminal domain-containing protein n=1 Tax=Scleroderma citrinum Foug A TaxID=1036808 RepID=A0A0C3CQH5_9AGAM|nr:hypothetical protein SCLCIDRAFT_33938 [Scleroderma citrinum Foug A]